MNFQNIPRDDKTVKRAILPKRGALSFFDYSQVEPRLFAYFTAVGLRDTTIADWYREGRDVYVEIAARATGKSPSDITPEDRQNGKVWFLMSLYGAGPKKVGAELGIPYAEALEFYKAFHAGLPQIRGLSNPKPRSENAWRNYEPGLVELTLKKRGYLKTLWGRHLHVPEFGEHKMLNTLIQGSAADLMKASLLKVDRWIREAGIETRMVSVVHDEIILDGPESDIDLLHEAVPPLMRDERITEVIPLDIDHEVSTSNWAEKTSYEQWKEQS